MEVRLATEHDVDGITATLTAAFAADPLWSWAFPGGGLADLWRLLVSSALRYPWVWVADDYAAASVWIPPGGIELTDAEEASLGPMLDDLVGSRATEVQSLFTRLAETHPDRPPHYYLSLLGTHPDHRGKGLGMALLAENLAMIDPAEMPAYLESSNPDNDTRYERLGFVRAGEFQRPDGQLTCSTMWREPRQTPSRR
ncbi:MAG TPA: GNAT family N-acetyltransferase [Solirubrobacterales bacterium]|jgi:GNAT superfamily N-acetyltransferase|nr:GNAT family N-acetyltransferase [Solirubrobacterales bacterium]